MSNETKLLKHFREIELARLKSSEYPMNRLVEIYEKHDIAVEALERYAQVIHILKVSGEVNKLAIETLEKLKDYR